MALREWWTRVTQLFGTRSHREQDQRREAHAQRAARSPAEEISQREDRRLAGMSADDREWEQASLGRDRDKQTRTRDEQGSPSS